MQNRWFDRYDWNTGASAWTPGFGTVSDDDGTYLKNHGGANSFDMECRWNLYLSGTITINPNYYNEVDLRWK